ncbi:hypothetical protein [Streptomyces sp. NPDC059639]|uniref:hypothetical protein n=1 Tax=Streptomyces sp. NPDC059639 TaxID=3346891 RepID=UPI0036D12BFE
MGGRDDFLDRWAEHLWIDYAVAACVVGAHVAVVRMGSRGDFLAWIDSSQRTDLYAAAAGVTSAIGGLSAIAISLYSAANGQRLRAVRAQHQHSLRRSWRSLLQGTALVCLLLLAALALDRDHDPLSVRFVFEYAMAFAACRYARLIWLFDRIMHVSDADLSDPGTVDPPARDPNWVRRRQRNSP